MGALPKRKISKARRGERRSHLRLILPALVPCRQCHTLKLAYHVCPTCGSYAGREAVAIKTAKKKER